MKRGLALLTVLAMTAGTLAGCGGSRAAGSGRAGGRRFGNGDGERR